MTIWLKQIPARLSEDSTADFPQHLDGLEQHHLGHRQARLLPNALRMQIRGADYPAQRDERPLRLQIGGRIHVSQGYRYPRGVGMPR